MTNEQKYAIRTMRKDGMGYVRIARTIGISENTVKSFCHRDERKREEAPSGEHFCLCCGIPVEQNPGRKEKKFCSDACRMKWWNSHPDQVEHRTTRKIVCANCGKTFTAYGSTPRKYCCHACYVEHRFGGDRG